MQTETIELAPGMEMKAFHHPEADNQVSPPTPELPVLSDEELMKWYHNETFIEVDGIPQPIIERAEIDLDTVVAHTSGPEYEVPADLREFTHNLLVGEGITPTASKRKFLGTGILPPEEPKKGGFNGPTIYVVDFRNGNGVQNFLIGNATYHPFHALCLHADLPLNTHDTHAAEGITLRSLETQDGSFKDFNDRFSPNMVGTGTALLAPSQRGGWYFIGGKKINTELYRGTCDVVGRVVHPSAVRRDEVSFGQCLIDDARKGCEKETGYSGFEDFQIIGARLIDEPPRLGVAFLMSAITSTPIEEIAQAYASNPQAPTNLNPLYAIPAEQVALAALPRNGFKVSPGATTARDYALRDLAKHLRR